MLRTEHYSAGRDFYLLNTELCWHYRGNISSRFSRKLFQKPLTNVVELFRRRMIGHIQIEYRYFVFNHDVSKFETEWAHGTFFQITNDRVELLI